MTWTRLLMFAMLCVVAGVPLAAQNPPPKNPLEGNPDAIQVRHGALPVPLRGLPRHGRARRSRARPHAGLGVGPNRRGPFQDDQGRRARHRDAGATRACSTTKSGRSSPICARWLRPRRPIPRAATPRTVRRSFARTAPGCHRVNGVGGRLGPDLSRIGVARSRDAIVMRRFAAAREDFRPGYEPVTITPQTDSRSTA